MFFPSPAQRWNTATTALPQWEPVAGPALLAVDLDTLKNWLNIPLEDTHFDAEKTSLAKAAQRLVERYISASLTPTRWVGYLPTWADQIRLDKRPFRSVEKIEYVAPVTGTIGTVDPETYIAGRLSQKCGVISRGDGCAWPDIAKRWDAVRITILSGYDNTASSVDDTAMHPMPEGITQALLVTIGALDKARGDGNAQSNRLANTVYGQKHAQAPSVIPNEAKDLLGEFRQIVVGF